MHVAGLVLASLARHEAAAAEDEAREENDEYEGAAGGDACDLRRRERRIVHFYAVL